MPLLLRMGDTVRNECIFPQLSSKTTSSEPNYLYISEARGMGD